MFRDRTAIRYGISALFRQADPYQYEIGFSQWKGTRPVQNDVIGIAGNDPRKGVLLSLADGIGTGEPAGMAANAAISAIRADYEHNRPDRELRAQVLRMMGSAQRQVMALNSLRPPQTEAVGAAVACLLVRNGWMYSASVGNVRVFLVRCGRMLQLNRDHLQSLEAEQQDILAGVSPRLDPKMALSVTAYIGKEGLKELDFLQQDLRLLPGDSLLLMSSGLYGVLSEEEIVQAVEAGSPQKAADSVIDQMWAQRRESQSNASIAILNIGIR